MKTLPCVVNIHVTFNRSINAQIKPVGRYWFLGPFKLLSSLLLGIFPSGAYQCTVPLLEKEKYIMLGTLLILLSVTESLELPFCPIYQRESWFIFETNCLKSFSVNTRLNQICNTKKITQLKASTTNSYSPVRATTTWSKVITQFALVSSPTSSKTAPSCWASQRRQTQIQSSWRRQRHARLSMRT